MIDATANSDPPRPQARLTTRRSVLWTLASVGGVGIAGSGLYSVAAGFSDPTAIRTFISAERRRRLSSAFLSRLGGIVDMVAGSELSSFRLTAPLSIKAADDEAALLAVNSLLTTRPDFKRVAPADAFAEPRCIISAGSPITNIVSRMTMFDTIVDGDINKIRVRNKVYILPYNFVRGTVNQLVRTLDGRNLIEPNHKIRSAEGIEYSSMLDGFTAEPHTGYLLFSVLPNPLFSGHCVSVWAGNTGPATEASRLLMNDESMISESDVQTIAELSATHQFFQILFEVGDISFSPEDNRHIPGYIQMIKGSLRPVLPA